MYPILISLGVFHLYSMSVFLVLSWCVFSFLFWRRMREYAVEEDKTFNCMFYGTMYALVGARLVYVALHWSEFGDAILKIAAFWVSPGLSLYGGLFFGTGAMLLFAKKSKIRVGMVLDGLAPALAAGLIVGKIGSFLGGNDVGIIRAGGIRHPIALYEAISLLVIFVGILVLERTASKRKWAYGIVGIIFFILYSTISFGLEFMKESNINLRGLTMNQWILLALFCESVGALYVRMGKKQLFRGIYGWFSKRRTH